MVECTHEQSCWSDFALRTQLPPLQPISRHDAPPPHRPTHVSFARSQTLTSSDDALSGKPIVAQSQKSLIVERRMGKQQQQGNSALGESPTVINLGE